MTSMAWLYRLDSIRWIDFGTVDAIAEHDGRRAMVSDAGALICRLFSLGWP